MDEERVLDKLDQLEQYLEEFRQDKPDTIEYYKSEKRKYERLFQLCIETVIDINALIVKQEGLGTPADEDSLITKLVDAEIIDEELGNKILEIKGFRNVLIHQYGRIDDQKAFSNIQNLQDFDKFKKEIKDYLQDH